jgi:hypothetical protein
MRRPYLVTSTSPDKKRVVPKIQVEDIRILILFHLLKILVTVVNL